MKKITIIALHLGYGGIEKAITSLANMLCDDFQVKIISTYKMYEKPSFALDERVEVKYLLDSKPNKEDFLRVLKKGKLISAIKEGFKSVGIIYLKYKMMIEAIKNDDANIIISTRILHNKMVSKYAKDGVLKIAWEHNHHNNRKNYINNLIDSCENLDYLVLVSKELNNFYNNKIDNHKTICKYISLSLDYIPSKPSKLNKREITAIGRLSKEKGFIDLIDVFKIVNDKYRDWHLNIVGDGLEKDNIVRRVRERNLEESITLHGYKSSKELNDILNNSSMYVMTSLTESFGLVLIEAMSYGIPCISFSSAQGALEIIDNNVNGYIIDSRNKEEMATKIISLIEDKKKRHEMGEMAYEKAFLFSPKEVKEEWMKLFNNKQHKV